MDEKKPESIAAALAPIWTAYRRDDHAAAVAAGRAAVAAHPQHGEAWFWLGCALERDGDLRQADRCFMRAAKAPVEPQGAPFRVSWRHFQLAVRLATEALPPKLRQALDEVTLVLADYAEPALLEGYDEPELMGLFVGMERGDLDGPAEAQPSPCIYLFRRAHEHVNATRSEFDDDVQQTLWHELGHYLGYDEEGLEELGRG
jgi:predicted Zn-dependent protease with MMP-like domain